MTDEWRRANELFHAALERPDDERAAFVADRAGADTALRDEVLSLLEAHQRAGAFLESPVHVPDGLSAGSAGGEGAAAGRMIGSYRIEQELGRGGMGVVYLAEDVRLGRRVALKALAPSYTHDEQRRERLRKEAQAAARLSHPNIATVFALEQIGEDLFIASEYVPGPTLRTELETGTMPIERVLRVAAQIARALAAAHAANVVHRDLKPENIVCSDSGTAKILDFGIARSPVLPGQARLTEAGAIVGTPGYMSPEQIEAQDIDFRSDIFSLGVLLYEMATGVHPFEGRTAASTIGRILALDPRPPSQLRPLPPEFDRIVRKCLQKRAEDRYQSTTDIAIDLEQLAGGGHAAPQPHRAPDAAGGTDTGVSVGARWWRVHQISVVAVYAAMSVVAGVASQWVGREWSTGLFFVGVAAAALNGTLRVHLLFSERHNLSAFRAELRRAAWWLRGSDMAFGGALLALAFAVGHGPPSGGHGRSVQMSVAILLAAVSAGSIISSIAVEPATTEAAFPQQPGT